MWQADKGIARHCIIDQNIYVINLANFKLSVQVKVRLLQVGTLSYCCDFTRFFCSISLPVDQTKWSRRQLNGLLLLCSDLCHFSWEWYPSKFPELLSKSARLLIFFFKKQCWNALKKINCYLVNMWLTFRLFLGGLDMDVKGHQCHSWFYLPSCASGQGCCWRPHSRTCCPRSGAKSRPLWRSRKHRPSLKPSLSPKSF